MTNTNTQIHVIELLTWVWSHQEYIFIVTSRFPRQRHQRISTTTTTKYGVTSKHVKKSSLLPFFWNHDVDIVWHSTNGHNVEVAFQMNSCDLVLVQTEKNNNTIFIFCLLLSCCMIQKALTVFYLTCIKLQNTISQQSYNSKAIHLKETSGTSSGVRAIHDSKNSVLEWVLNSQNLRLFGFRCFIVLFLFIFLINHFKRAVNELHYSLYFVKIIVFSTLVAAEADFDLS